MVGFVIVSHSRKLAEGVVELAKMMAPGCPSGRRRRPGGRKLWYQL